MPKERSANAKLVWQTANKLIKRNGGFCTFVELGNELKVIRKPHGVRNDYLINYLLGGKYLIECHTWRIYQDK